jgi:GntR family transcriptional repressor for pyruvate dehydrogenase complex
MTNEGMSASAARARRGDKQIAPVKTEAAYEVVIRQIMRAIQLGEFVAGDRLPPERELAEQLGVARMTVREALKVLAAHGVLSIRRGAHGGITVSPQMLSERELLALAADAKSSVSDVFEFRALVEGAAARIAAKRITSADARRLRGLVREISRLAGTKSSRTDPANVARFIAADSQFHFLIGEISGNALLREAIERALTERFAPLGAVFREIAEGADKGHEEILAALESGEGSKAQQLMAEHIDLTRREILAMLSKVRAKR